VDGYMWVGYAFVRVICDTFLEWGVAIAERFFWLGRNIVHWHWRSLMGIDVDVIIDIYRRRQSFIISQEHLAAINLSHAANSHQFRHRTIAVFRIAGKVDYLGSSGIQLWWSVREVRPLGDKYFEFLARTIEWLLKLLWSSWTVLLLHANLAVVDALHWPVSPQNVFFAVIAL